MFVFVSFVLQAHLLCETLVGPDPESPSDTFGPNNNNHHPFHPHSPEDSSSDGPESRLVKTPLDLLQQPPPAIAGSHKPARLSLERSFSAEEDKLKCVECALQPARIYTITSQHGMLMSGGRGSKESLELDVLKEKSGGGGAGPKGGSHTALIQPSTSPSSNSSSPTQHHHAGSSRGTSSHHHGNHHHGNHHRPGAPSSSGGGASSGGGTQPSAGGGGSHSHHGSHHHTHHHHHLAQPPLQTSVSAHNIRSWGEAGKGEAECSVLACDSCGGAPSRSQGSLDLESASREPGKQRRRVCVWVTGWGGGGVGCDRLGVSTDLKHSCRVKSLCLWICLIVDDTNWFPKENMFSFQTATTTMQA